MQRLLLELKQELVALQRKGRKFLNIEKLVQYCDFASNGSDAEVRSEGEERDYVRQMEVWRIDVETNRQGTQFVNEAAFHALKTLVLLAGGSSAAVFAFLGAVWTGVTPAARMGLVNGIGFFGSALIGAAFAYGLAYLTLLAYFEYEARRAGNFLRLLTIILVLSCYFAMGLGLLSCYRAII